MATYFQNGHTYLPGITLGSSGQWGLTETTGGRLAMVYAPWGTQTEVYTVSTAGAFRLAPTGVGITGLYAVTLSTISPASIAAGTGNIETYPSTNITWSTNDLILSIVLPSSYASTGVGIAGGFPTSSGGVGFNWINADSTTGGAVSPSTGAYVVVTLRTT